jgi:glycosyltransferase involved in cell wall biosynthesis
MLGKKLVFTAHNIDQQERDRESTIINKLSLKILYNVVDHIFVHTKIMKDQLIDKFNISENKIYIIPFGINYLVPVTSINREESKKKLGLDSSENIILFFGRIAPYKGLDLLISAFERVVKSNNNYRLVIAGHIKERNLEKYWKSIQEMIVERELQKYITQRIEYIPDEEIEIYYKSADVLILPYRHIFQTGVLFIAYYFGLPVIATDVGSFREDIVEGKTGFVCKDNDEICLSENIIEYFQSNLHKNIEYNRKYIQDYANDKYSWEKVSIDTIGIYKKLLNM